MSSDRGSQTSPQAKKSLWQRISRIITRPKKVRYSTIRGARKAAVDFFFYIIYLTLASVVTQTTTQTTMYYYNEAMERLIYNRKTIIEPGLTNTFNEINDIDRFWQFLIYTFLPMAERGDFRPQDMASVYEHTNETNQFDEIFGDVLYRTIMHGNVLLGPPRLRQIRVKNGTCPYNPTFSKYIQKPCCAPYTWFNEDRGVYHGVKWKGMSETGSTPIWGKVEIYLGAGFVINFSYDPQENYELARKLKNLNWIERGTAAVVLEFSFYHVNTRLFETAKFILELPPTGSCMTMVDLRVIRRDSLFYDESLKIRIIVFTFYFIIFVSSCKEWILIGNMGFCNYISQSINLIDFLSCVLSYLMVALHVGCHYYVEKIMASVRTSNEYVSFDLVSEIFTIGNNISAIVICLGWFRMLHFVVFNRTMVIFANTLHRSKHEMLGFLFIFFTIFMAYAQCGMTIFGGNDHSFSNMITSIMTMIQWIVCDLDYDSMMHPNHITTRIYYISFVISVYVILIFSFQAIINNTYDGVKKLALTRPSCLGTVIRLFFRDIYDFFYWIVCCKRKKRPKIDLDHKGELESDQRLDPHQAAAEAAMRRNAHKNPVLLSQDEYLPARLDLAYKRVKALEEVIVPVFKRLTDFNNRLRKEKGLPELKINFEMPDWEAN